MTNNSHSNNNYHHNHQDCDDQHQDCDYHHQDCVHHHQDCDDQHQDCDHHHQDCDDEHQDACGVKIGRCGAAGSTLNTFAPFNPSASTQNTELTKHCSQNTEHKTNNNKRLCTPRHQFALCLLWTCVHKLNIKVQFIEQPTIAQLNNTQP